MMELCVKGIEVDCIIGERDYERSLLQRIVVDARLEVDGAAAESDELEDAVDYVALAEDIRRERVAAKCRLIERAALVAARTCLARRGIFAAEIEVAKSGAVPGVKCAVAKIRLAK